MKVFQGWIPIWDAVLDLVYPTRCAACDRIGHGIFCEACRQTLKPLAPPFCERCQDPGAEGVCSRCRSHPPAFAVARAAALFEGPLREAIHALKYEKRERVAEALAEILEAAWKREPALHGVEALLPLPIHAKREKERGFNQSAAMAETLGRKLSLPVLKKALIRPVFRRPQVGLGRDERAANVEGVFQVETPEAVSGKSLLLVDDVMTTGATCNEAARTLLQAGARDVRILVLAREP
jgi:ComF family protein